MSNFNATLNWRDCNFPTKNPSSKVPRPLQIERLLRTEWREQIPKVRSSYNYKYRILFRHYLIETNDVKLPFFGYDSEFRSPRDCLSLLVEDPEICMLPTRWRRSWGRFTLRELPLFATCFLSNSASITGKYESTTTVLLLLLSDLEGCSEEATCESSFKRNHSIRMRVLVCYMRESKV